MTKITKLKKYNIRVGELLDLLNWAAGFSVIEGETQFKYNTELGNLHGVDKRVSIDVSSYIDDLFVDLYKYYEKMKLMESKKIETEIMNSPMFSLLDEKSINETKRSAINFVKVYNKLITEYKFTSSNSRGIQKFLIEDIIKDYIYSEDYEKCAELRDKLEQV